jgi:hypothetical protein
MEATLKGKLELLQSIANELSDDVQINITPYRKNKDGEFNWLFNFKGSGFNDVWAKTKDEAIANAKSEFRSEVDETSFRKATEESWDAQNRMGWMMSI